MLYSPHTLHVKRQPTVAYDDYGQAVVSGSTEYTYVCKCRCDDSTMNEITDENGNLFRPSYHIVCPKDGAMQVRCGDDVECLCGDGTIRGKGLVKNIRRYNFLDYSEIWV